MFFTVEGGQPELARKMYASPLSRMGVTHASKDRSHTA
jgi:hypothetical protein